MTAGVTTPNVDQFNIADEVLVNRLRSTGRMGIAKLAQQILSQPAFAGSAFATIAYFRPSRAGLNAVTPSLGTHGAVLSNDGEAGIYRFDGATWVWQAPIPAVLTESLSAIEAKEARDQVVALLETVATLNDLESLADQASDAASQAAIYNQGPLLDSPAAVEADTTLAYSAAPGKVHVAVDQTVRTRDGHNYRVRLLGVADYHLATSGGVLLDLLPGADGVYSFSGVNPAGDGVTDDWPKLRRLLAIRQPQGSATYPMGPTIRFDGRKFYLGTDAHGIQLKALTHLIGQAQGQNNFEAGTVFRFPPGVKGLVVNRYNTLNGGKESVPTGGADGSTSQDIAYQSSVSADKAAHAIQLRARAWIKNAFIRDWGGNGIHIVANAGGGAAEEGNANNWRVDGGRAQGCEHGLYLLGMDANAGNAFSFDGSGCRRWGIFDQSFLGNTFTGCHTASCGSSSSEGKSAYALFGGKYYHAVPPHVGGATEAHYVSTEPGTNPNVWRECNPTSGNIAWAPGLAEGTYRTGGGYCSTNANARSSFVSCYSEGGQGLTWLSQHSIAIGGFFLEVPVASGANFEGRFQKAWSRFGFAARVTRQSDGLFTESSLGGDVNSRAAFEWNVGEEGVPWRLQYDSGFWIVQQGNQSGRVPFMWSSTDATWTFGTASPKPYTFVTPVHALGQGLNARRRFTATAVPSAGEYGRGDIIYNINAAGSGKLGWVCTTAGEAGSTAVFKTFGAIDA